MEGFFILLILLVVGCLVCGPIALIISIVALKRSRDQAAIPFSIRAPVHYGTRHRPQRTQQTGECPTDSVVYIKRSGPALPAGTWVGSSRARL